MRKIVLIALLLTLAMGTAVAKQNGGNGGNKPPANGSSQGHRGDPIAHLTEELGLDADQVAEITAIFEETQALRDEERENSRLIFCEIRENSHDQVFDVLTPEQQVLFEEMQQRRYEMRRALEEARAEHGYGNGGGHGMMDCDG